jgi:hypothetical protein
MQDKQQATKHNLLCCLIGHNWNYTYTLWFPVRKCKRCNYRQHHAMPGSSINGRTSWRDFPINKIFKIK